MKKYKTCFATVAVVFTFFLWLFYFPKTADAQTFSLSPSSGTQAVDEEFTVNLNIDTAGKAAAGADIKITFDATALEVTDVEKGDFFSDEAHNIGSGTLFISGFFQEQFATKTGSGKVAVLTLKGKKAGTATLTFVCTSQTNDSNILDASANDLINCSGTSNATYTFAGDGSSSSTPTPTSTGGSSQSPTATPPVSGVALPTFFSIGIGILLTVIGIAVIL